MTTVTAWIYVTQTRGHVDVHTAPTRTEAREHIADLRTLWAGTLYQGQGALLSGPRRIVITLSRRPLQWASAAGRWQ